jgi:hypothetical protein
VILDLFPHRDQRRQPIWHERGTMAQTSLMMIVTRMADEALTWAFRLVRLAVLRFMR